MKVLLCVGSTSVLSKHEIDDIYRQMQCFMGVEGKNNCMNRYVNGHDPQINKTYTNNQAAPSSFGMPTQSDHTQKYKGIGSQRLPCFGKVYRVIRLKSCIIQIRKFYPVCLQRFKGMLIKNYELNKQYL
mgnify:CR=1 FL=1